MTHRLKRARELSGLTLGQAASRLGVSDRTLARLEEDPSLEKGYDSFLSVDMAKVYGCSLEWLRGEPVKPPEEVVALLQPRDGLSVKESQALLELFTSMSRRT